MTRYQPRPKEWHDQVPGQCYCGEAFKSRGIVDALCGWHDLIEAIEILRDHEWQIAPPETGGKFAAINIS